MIFIYLIILIHAMSAMSIDLKGLIPRHKVRKCVEGSVIQNNCMMCDCKRDHYYHCERTPCNDDHDNVLLGKPMQAICQPRMVYIHKSTTCICSKYGYWPHDKCDFLFKSLYKKFYKSLKCEPKSYVIIGCNVCKCGLNGLVDKRHCTKNDCNEIKVQRRTIDNVHGSCEPNNWYSLAPCQFCYCVHQNKLVCSTGNTKQQMLELGAYNLTVCGKGLLKEVVELIPDGLKALRDGEKLTTTPITTTTLTTPSISDFRTSVMTTSRPYEPELNIQNITFKFDTQLLKSGDPIGPVLDYESDSEEIKFNNKSALITRDGSTVLPYEGSENEESTEDDDKTQQFSDVNYQPLYKPQSLQVVTPESLSIFQEPEVTTPVDTSEDSTTDSDKNRVRIHLPSVLDQLLQLALRKSMVKLESTKTKCTPGTTIQDKCNYCHCLTNGKLLCTAKEC